MLAGSANGETIVDMVEKEFEQRQLNRGDEVDMYFPPDAFSYLQEGLNRPQNRTDYPIKKLDDQ